MTDTDQAAATAPAGTEVPMVLAEEVSKSFG